MAYLKLVSAHNWKGFADSFAGYDILAWHSRGYALAYPLIELSLAWFFLSGFQPMATNASMLAIMCIGSFDVLRVIQTGEVRKCACVGSGFDLPVGRVALVDNTVMGEMALMALLH